MTLGSAPTVGNCRIVDLQRVVDPRGSLTFLEGQKDIPFKIQRAYWIYDVPGGAIRGGHAYRTLDEFIIALSGSFDVLVDDGTERRSISLNRSYFGLHVPPLIWRSLTNFSTNAVTLILASMRYSPDDYVYDRSQFERLRTAT